MSDLTRNEPMLSGALDGVDPVLCYIEGDRAFFTTQALDQQWGDHWNDVPYEHNAERPYKWREGSDKPYWRIVEIVWEGDYETPADIHWQNHNPYSVEMINRRDAAWLTPASWARQPKLQPIFAGTGLNEFKRRIKESGGRIFIQEVE